MTQSPHPFSIPARWHRCPWMRSSPFEPQGSVSCSTSAPGSCPPSCTGAPTSARSGLSDWEALRRAQQMPVMNNGVDVPLRLALVPEGRAGWMGRPGLSGSRGGRDWSPRFEVVELEVDGQPVTGGVHTSGAGSVRVACRDEGAELELELLVESTPQGLLRTRARGPQSGGGGLPGGRTAGGPACAGAGARAAGLHRTMDQGTPTAAPSWVMGSIAARTAVDAPGGRRPPALPGHPGFRPCGWRSLGGAHRLERQPRPLRRTREHRAAGDRRWGSCCCQAR